VQACGPAQAVDVGVGKAERAGQRVDVPGDTHRVAIGVRIPLVDDVRERLERVQRLQPRPPDARMRFVDGERDRDDHQRVPRMADGAEGDDRPEPRLRGGCRKVGLEHLQVADDLQQSARDDQVRDGEQRQRHEVVRKRELSRVSASEDERVTGRQSGERECRGLEEREPPGPADEARQQRRRTCDERPAPGPEHDHGGDVHARGDPEHARPHRRPHAPAFRLLQELGRERGRAQQRKRGQRLADSCVGAGHGSAEAGRDGRVGED
jgi:hypothetical protein